MAAATLMAPAGSAQACRAAFSPAERLSMGYRAGAISAAVLVRVTEAHYTRGRFSDAHPWRATATVEGVLRGAYPARNVVFERGWGSAACDDGHAVPAAGERWVVYFWRRGPGDQPVWYSYPAQVAFAADPIIGPRRR